MKTLTFSNNHEMPILGLGTWKSEAGKVYNAVKEALKIGYRHVDCAYIYGNEAEIGQALSEAFQEGILSREELWVTSKLWNNAHHTEDVEPAIKQTLSDLKLDYLDLYLIHWPVMFKKGVHMPQSGADFMSLEELPIIDTWRAMEELVDKGLAKHIGVSNFSKKKIENLLAEARIKPEANQVELHPYLQQKDLVAFCQQNGVHMTAYSPLGSPDRPDRLRTEDDPILLEDPTVQGIAQELGVSVAQVLLSWSIHRGVSVIPKSVTPSRIQQNFDAANLALTSEHLETIAALDRHRRYVAGAFWCPEGSPYTLANLWDE